MNITSLKELSKLIDLCRKKGVESLELSGIKLNLSKDAPPKKLNSEQSKEAVEEPQYTDEEMLLWSSTPNQ